MLAGAEHVLGLPDCKGNAMQMIGTEHESLTVDMDEHDKPTCYVWQNKLCKEISLCQH